MTRAEILQEIIDAVSPLDEITEDTLISESDDLDSLGLFNVVLMLNGHGIKPTLTQLSQCKKVSDIIDMVENKMK